GALDHRHRAHDDRRRPARLAEWPAADSLVRNRSLPLGPPRNEPLDPRKRLGRSLLAAGLPGNRARRDVRSRLLGHSGLAPPARSTAGGRPLQPLPSARRKLRNRDADDGPPPQPRAALLLSVRTCGPARPRDDPAALA